MLTPDLADRLGVNNGLGSVVADDFRDKLGLGSSGITRGGLGMNDPLAGATFGPYTGLGPGTLGPGPIATGPGDAFNNFSGMGQTYDFQGGFQGGIRGGLGAGTGIDFQGGFNQGTQNLGLGTSFGSGMDFQGGFNSGLQFGTGLSPLDNQSYDFSGTGINQGFGIGMGATSLSGDQTTLNYGLQGSTSTFNLGETQNTFNLGGLGSTGISAATTLSAGSSLGSGFTSAASLVQPLQVQNNVVQNQVSSFVTTYSMKFTI